MTSMVPPNQWSSAVEGQFTPLREHYATVSYRWRYSAKGVPHVLLTNGVETISLCWFESAARFRLFTRYGKGRAVAQTRLDFATLCEAWLMARSILKTGVVL